MCRNYSQKEMFRRPWPYTKGSKKFSHQVSRIELMGRELGERWFLVRNRDPCRHLRAPDLSRFTQRAENWPRWRSNDNAWRAKPASTLLARFARSTLSFPIVHALESQIVVRTRNYVRLRAHDRHVLNSFPRLLIGNFAKLPASLWERDHWWPLINSYGPHQPTSSIEIQNVMWRWRLIK